jgi:hypothetical protein
MIINSAMPPPPPVPTTPWAANAGEINIPTFHRRDVAANAVVQRVSRAGRRGPAWDVGAVRRRVQRTFRAKGGKPAGMSSLCAIVRGEHAAPRPLKPHWYRGLEGPSTDTWCTIRARISISFLRSMVDGQRATSSGARPSVGSGVGGAGRADCGDFGHFTHRILGMTTPELMLRVTAV